MSHHESHSSGNSSITRDEFRNHGSERMIARRGCPTEIWSDNGTNLRGAARELHNIFNENMKTEANLKTIRWRFIPPGAPFMGGAWERLIRSVKNSLNTVLLTKNPTEEVLNTLLAEVEYTVNNRPLTYVTTDPEAPESLTPNHFLLGGSAAAPAPGTFNESDLNSRAQWRVSTASRYVLEPLASGISARVTTPAGAARSRRSIEDRRCRPYR
ncbi:hypothetical protein EVAR_83630_1 [Eumeta japonica]|uniref:Integrase catalytic domain-containing protein n=1 Tax=Eumeta variegata TaxID=151549 RepID=A0A4C1UNT6_EUMVA|nr:hypothetical protein EVAR_83630_1 [Eumeta japonica]